MQMDRQYTDRSEIPRRGVDLGIHGGGGRGGVQLKRQPVRGRDWEPCTPEDSREEGRVPVVRAWMIGLDFLKSLPQDVQQRRLEKDGVYRGSVPF